LRCSGSAFHFSLLAKYEPAQAPEIGFVRY
jgi:hypothetical protein